MAGNVSITGQLTQLTTGSKTIGPYTIAPNTANEEAVTNIKLASGNNTIAIPTWAVGCIITPDPTNAIQVTNKGAPADTGELMSLTQPWLKTFPAVPPASFVLTAAAPCTTFHNIEFF